jgi:hypothetical protein
LAITEGSHIHFAPGRYSPTMVRQLLQHELAHVIQQRSGRVRNPFGAGAAVVHHPALEAEAARAAAGGRAGHANDSVLQPFWAELGTLIAAGAIGALAAPLVGVTATTGALTGAGLYSVTALYNYANQPAAHVPGPVAAAPLVAPPALHVPAPALAVAPAPVLTAIPRGAADLENPVGGFVRVRDWNVANPVAGVIVQEINRAFDVRLTNAPTVRMTALQINNYVTGVVSRPYAGETRYWELWEVDAHGHVSDGGDDTFQLCAIIPGRRLRDTTLGTFDMTGQASFYAGRTPAGLGFVRNAVACAGGLFSRVNAPVLPAATSGPVNYAVHVVWDSTSGSGDAMYSNVT